MKILITGATGLIGKALGRSLVQKGHQIVVVSRNGKKAKLEIPFPCEIIETDLNASKLSSEKLQGVEAVFHLAGENVGEGTWSEKRKKEILNSRTETTKNLLESFLQVSSLKVFISAGAIGYYGDRKDEELTEESVRGTGFLSDVCFEWENVSREFEENAYKNKVRFVRARTGVVFSSFGGAFLKMLLPFQMGVGSPLGDGKQWLSWIHLQDLVSVFHELLNNSQIKGAVNVVAPEPVQNLEFSKKLAKLVGAWSAPSVPKFVLKTALGEMAEIVLASQKVFTQKIPNHLFQFPSLDLALKDLCQYAAEGDQVFYAEQFLDVPRDKVFQFFAEAQNLEKITPDLLNFKIQSMSTKEIQENTEIVYRLKVHGLPISWKTLITNWQPPEKFVDTQLSGPYTKWHHTHSFISLGNGTLMTDLVRYRLPVGKLGQIFGGSFVKGDVEKIFSFRRAEVEKFFL